MFTHYQAESAPKPPSGPVSVSFTQINREKNSAVPGVDGEIFDDKKCYSCKQMDRFSKFYPGKGHRNFKGL